MADDRASIIAARRAQRAGRDDSGDHGPALPDVQQHVVRPTDPVIGRVVASELCTRGKSSGFVRHVTIDLSGTPLAGAFVPGQSFGVVPDGLDDRGKPHKPRLYSISSPTRGEEPAAASGTGGAHCQSTPIAGPGSNGALISTTVKRTIDEHWESHRLFLGVASNMLCDAQIGDELRVTGPAGKRFILPDQPGDHDYLFIATGTGIAPFRGMILDLLERGVKSKIVLVMGSPYATDLLYHDWLEALAETHPNFHYLTAISREQLQIDGVPGRFYVQHRLEHTWDLVEPMLTGTADSPGRGLVYMCGIAGMELGVLSTLWTRLSTEARAVYIDTDDDASDPTAWTRQMIRRQVRPTRRVFLEVY